MNALTKAAPAAAVSTILRPQTWAELERFAEYAARSDMVPKDYQGKPANVLLAVQMGSEVGLAPMQAIQNIAIINGRPAVWGDAMLGLCKSHPQWLGIKETIEGEGDARVAVCEVSRAGEPLVVRRFSVQDAKRAGLWQTEAKITRRSKFGDGKTYATDNDSPWWKYPERMLQFRARGWALRDAFPDKLRGLGSAEEAQDMRPADDFTGATIDAKPEPPPRAQHAESNSPRDTQAAEAWPSRAPADPPPESTPRKRKIGDIVAEVRAAVVAARTVREVLAIGDGADVAALMKHANAAVQAEVKALLAEAYADAERREAEADDAAEAEIEGDPLAPDDGVPFDEPIAGEKFAGA